MIIMELCEVLLENDETIDERLYVQSEDEVVFSKRKSKRGNDMVHEIQFCDLFV